MTKDYFIQLAEYNTWANGLIWSWIDKLSDEQWEQPLVSSFNSTAETAIHIVSAETIWADRLNSVETAKQVWLASSFRGTKTELVKLWKQASTNLEAFIRQFDETKLQADLYFKRLNGEPYNMPFYQVFAHIFNHSTFHRGQLITLLRQTGFTAVSSTDLLQYFRK